MADGSASEKTEQPTPHHLQRARQQGRIPQSQELGTTLMLAALVLASALAAGDLWQFFSTEIAQGLSARFDRGLDVDAVVYLLKTKFAAALTAMAPFFLGGAVASVLGGVLVSGWVISPGAMKMSFARLAPSNALKQIWSPRSLIHLVVSLLKLAILAGLAATYLRDKLPLVLALTNATPLGAMSVTFQVLLGLMTRIIIALAVISLGDVIYQKWQCKRDLRMTRQEVKEERKSHEGSPIVKSHIRSAHFAMVRKRMLRDVPTADVVVTNPTHVAVALKYDAATMQAPRVIAKGAELLCQKIKEIAREHGVPILERPELARTLYATVEIGQAIPEPLYVAVAEVLAMIYRMRKQRT